MGNSFQINGVEVLHRPVELTGFIVDRDPGRALPQKVSIAPLIKIGQTNGEFSVALLLLRIGAGVGYITVSPL
jgi:hypothetical protein